MKRIIGAERIFMIAATPRIGRAVDRRRLQLFDLIISQLQAVAAGTAYMSSVSARYLASRLLEPFNVTYRI
jgi:hypothetical protein